MLNRKFSPSESRTNHSRDVRHNYDKNLRMNLKIFSLLTIFLFSYEFQTKEIENRLDNHSFEQIAEIEKPLLIEKNKYMLKIPIKIYVFHT